MEKTYSKRIEEGLNMEYKTPMVAEKLGVSPKVVMRIVQQLQLNLEKNKFGHYVFSDEDLQHIIEYHQSSENASSLPQTAPQNNDSSEEIVVFKEQMQDLYNRMTCVEEKMNGKADDVVNYQILQHRSEIEELKQIVKGLEAKIEKLETKPYIAPVRDITAEKPKRRKMILSIFGF
jgi:chromosome-anchoring protein RacA